MLMLKTRGSMLGWKPLYAFPERQALTSGQTKLDAELLSSFKIAPLKLVTSSTFANLH